MGRYDFFEEEHRPRVEGKVFEEVNKEDDDKGFNENLKELLGIEE